MGKVRNSKHFLERVDNEQIVSLLKDMVSIRSDVDSKHTELKLSNFLESYFNKLKGWKLITQDVGPGRKNIIITTSNNPGVVIMGHQDTVPVNNKTQLKPRVVKNKLYGRGSVDMKAGLSIMLALAKEKPWRDTAMVFTVDEEYYFEGIKRFIKDNKWTPKIVINPEPSNLKIIYQCRGFTEIELVLMGKSAHAGRKKEGVNAIEQAVKFSFELEKMAQKYDENEMSTSLNLAGLEGGVLLNNEIGVRPNVVPDIAKITIELRLGSLKLTPKKLKEMVYKSAEISNISVQKYYQGLWFGPMLGDRKDLTSFIQAVNKSKFKVDFVEPDRTGFYEVQIAQERWGCPVVVFGPGPIEKSHQKDEYVDIESLGKLYEVVRNFLELETES